MIIIKTRITGVATNDVRDANKVPQNHVRVWDTAILNDNKDSHHTSHQKLIFPDEHNKPCAPKRAPKWLRGITQD